MTDFKGFNPDKKNLSTNFNAKRQDKKANSENSSAQGDTPSPGDPYANLKMPPGDMMDLLAAQAEQARFNIPNQIENSGIGRAVEAFTKQVSPEQHAQVSQFMKQAFISEFGTQPNDNLLQELVDNYLIGSVATPAE